MFVYTPALTTNHDALGGNGLKLAGQGFDLKKFLSVASKAGDIGIGLAGALGDDKTKERAQQAAAVKSVLDGKGIKIPTVSKKQGRKIKKAGKKGLDVYRLCQVAPSAGKG